MIRGPSHMGCLRCGKHGRKQRAGWLALPCSGQPGELPRPFKSLMEAGALGGVPPSERAREWISRRRLTVN